VGEGVEDGKEVLGGVVVRGWWAERRG